MAITFLLVVGETVAFRIMEKLSTGHLHECMEPTMETTSFRLNYMYPLLDREDKELFVFMDRYVDTVKCLDFVYVQNLKCKQKFIVYLLLKKSIRLQLQTKI